MHTLKRILLIIGIVVLVAVLTLGGLFKYTDTIDRYIEEAINKSIPVDTLMFQAMEGNPLSDVVFRNIQVKLKNGDVVRSNHLRVVYDFTGSTNGNVSVKFIYFDSLLYEMGERPENLNTSEADDDEGYFDLYDILGQNRIDVNQLEFRYGEIVIDRKSGLILSDINYNGDFHYNADEFRFGLTTLNGKWGPEKKRISIQTEISGNPAEMNFNQTRVSFEGTELIGKGLIQFNPANNFQFYIDKGVLRHSDISFLSSFFEYRGGYTFDMVASGDRNGMRMKWNLDSARIAHLRIDDAMVDCYYNFNRNFLNITESKLTLNGATVQAAGSILGENNDYTVNFRNLDLAKIGIGTIRTDLNGIGKVSQSKINFRGNSVEINTVKFMPSRFDKYQVRTGEVAFENIGNRFRINPESYLTFGRSARYAVQGNINGGTDSLDIRVTARRSYVDPIMRDLGADMINGRVDAFIRLFGSFDRVKARAVLTSDSLKITDEFNLMNSTLRFDGDDVFNSLTGFASISTDSARFLDTHGIRTYVSARLTPDSVNLDTIRFAIGGNAVRAKGSIATQDSTVNYRLDDLAYQYESYRIRTSQPLLIEQKANLFRVQSGQLRAPQGGQVDFSGIYLTSGESTLRADLKDIFIEPFNDLFGYQHRIGGRVNGDISILNLADFMYNVNLNLSDLVVKPYTDSVFFRHIGKTEIEFGDGAINYSFADQTHNINLFRLVQDSSRISFNGLVRSQYDTFQKKTVRRFNLNAELKDIDIARYNVFIEYYKRFEGLLNASFTLEGNSNYPRGRLTIETDGLGINTVDYAGKIEAEIAGDRLRFNPSQIKLNNSPVTISGWKALALDTTLDRLLVDGPFDFRVQSKTDTITALSALNPDISLITGDIELDFHIGGTFDKPYIDDGFFKFKDTRLYLQMLGNPILDIDYDGRIQNKRIVLENFSGQTDAQGELLDLYTSEGYVYLNGTVDLSDLFHPVLDLKAQMDNLYADYFSESAKIFINSDEFRIYGRDTLFNEGELTITAGDIYVDVENQVRSKYTRQVTLSEKAVVIDARINLLDNVRVYKPDPLLQSGFDMTMNTAVGRPINYYQSASGEVTYDGTINISDGTFTTLQTTFEVEQGSIDLSDQDNVSAPFNPKVDFLASYEAEAYFFRASFNDYLLNLSNVDLQAYDRNDLITPLNKNKFEIALLIIFGDDQNVEVTENMAVQTLVKSLAANNSITNIISDVEVRGLNETIPDGTNNSNPNQEAALRVKFKPIRIGKNWRVKAVVNTASNRDFLEKIEANYRIFNNLIFIVSSNESDEILTSQTIEDSREYNLKLQWYIEF